MKNKKTIKERLKKYFTDKPKKDFWFWAFITLFIFKYITPTMLIMVIPFQVGLIAPDTPINYQNISMTMTNSLMKPLEIMGHLGQTIGSQHRVVGPSLFYTFSYFIYVWWVAMIFLVINLIRYGISWAYRTKIKNQKRRKHEHRNL